MAKKTKADREEHNREEYIEKFHRGKGSEAVSFDLVDEHTVARLENDGKITVPKKRLRIPRDKRWNEKQMAGKVLRGIQNGDSVYDIAHSMLRVVGNNELSAIRNARTMVTSAENNGRLDSYKALDKKGVVQKKVWMSTPDDRTRPSHVDLDGEEQDIDKPFSNGCQFPGDGKGPAEEVWMCRCTMTDHIIGFRREDGSISRVDYTPDKTIHEEQMEDEKGRRTEEHNVSEISANQFKESAKENLTEAEEKELFDELDKYIDSVSGDTERLAELLDKMDDVKWNSDEPLYRGIGVQGYDPIFGKNTYEDLLKSYSNGEPFTMQSLSWSAQSETAIRMAESKGTHQIIYVDTTSGTRDMVSIRGITEETEGKWYADNTREVLATRTDMEFVAYKIEQDGNIAYVYVRELKER